MIGQRHGGPLGDREGSVPYSGCCLCASRTNPFSLRKSIEQYTYVYSSVCVLSFNKMCKGKNPPFHRVGGPMRKESLVNLRVGSLGKTSWRR